MNVEARRARGLSYAVVQTQEGEIGHGRLCGQGRRQVQRVQRPQGLARKGSPRPVEDFVLQSEENPVPNFVAEICPSPGGIGFLDLTHRRGPDKSPLALNDGEPGRDDQASAIDDLTYSRPGWLAEEPGQNRARFCVEVQRSPRSSSSRR